MNGLRPTFRSAVMALVTLATASCVPMNQTGDLNCKLESGSTVNVHEIYGTWTMTSGYTDGVRSDVDLENDYDVLVVQTGNAICRVVYEAQQPIETAFVGGYRLKASTKTLDISLVAPVSASVSAKYSFGGDCSNPTMTMTYSNGAVEAYRFRSKSVGDGCSFN